MDKDETSDTEMTTMTCGSGDFATMTCGSGDFYYGGLLLFFIAGDFYYFITGDVREHRGTSTQKITTVTE